MPIYYISSEAVLSAPLSYGAIVSRKHSCYNSTQRSEQYYTATEEYVYGWDYTVAPLKFHIPFSTKGEDVGLLGQ